MPMPCFLTIKGETMGLISAGALSKPSVGTAWMEGHEDQILVQSYESGIAVPSGKGVGRRMHKPFSIRKSIDKSSPLINTALCNGELLTLCRMEFYRPVGEGGVEHFYTVELKDAVIVGADAYMPDCREPRFEQFHPMETIRFSYREISWVHETAGTIGFDEWHGAN